MEAVQFNYRQFFARNDVGSPAVAASGAPEEEYDDEPIDDVPPPAWFRRRRSADAFPVCDALLSWPANYPVEGDADLSEAESEETDPASFRYSEPEVEAWLDIVEVVLLRFEEPVLLPAGSQPLLVITEKRPGETGASEVFEMANGYQQVQVAQQQPPRSRDPPIGKWAAGDLAVCAWSNPAPTGGRFITLTIDRRYRTEQGWRNTKSLRPNDAPLAVVLLQRAFADLALRHQLIEGVSPSGATPGRGAEPPRFHEVGAEAESSVFEG